MVPVIRGSMRNFDLILKSEELFAREVALGVVVTRPLKSWLYLIPGMFIVEFLRRLRSVRRYSDCYMAPRRQALSGAKAILEGAQPEQVRSHIAAEMQRRSASGSAEQTDLPTHQMRIIDILIAHYQKLLTASGTDYIQLLRSSYNDRVALEKVLKRLNGLERERDRCMPARVMDEYQKRHYHAIQSQVSLRRTRLVDAVF
jgi:hypothetical protein